jgi:hypothetical protein
MSTTLEAGSAEAAEAARRAQEAAATGMTQAEREAQAEHDGGVPDAGKRKKRTPQQGNLTGGWEDLIGGEPDTEIKVQLQKPAGVQFENQPEKLLKGSVHRILITVKITEFGSADTLDPETHDVATTKGKRKARVTSGVFLEPDQYIADAGDGVDVAEQAEADRKANA